MPKRNNTRRISTPDLQGEDSFVVLKMMGYGVSREALQTGDKSSEEQLAVTDKLIVDSLVDWNWVGDDGLPLPLPKNPDDLDRLTNEEAAFLIKAITGIGVAQAKN